MENVYEVFSTSGASLGIIVATEEVVNAKYPGRYVFIRENNTIPPVIISQEFKKRFTETELTALTNFVAAIQKTCLKNLLTVLDTVDAKYVFGNVPSDKDKAAAIAANILTAERADIVFSTHVTPAESPFY